MQKFTGNAKMLVGIGAINQHIHYLGVPPVQAAYSAISLLLNL